MVVVLKKLKDYSTKKHQAYCSGLQMADVEFYLLKNFLTVEAV